MTLIIASPVDGADVWSADVKLGWAENIRALSHEMQVESVVAYAQDVVRARNRLVDFILRERPSMTHVLWWDTDQWPENRGIVQNMIETGEDFVAAPYTNKRAPVRWIHQLLDPCPLAARELQEVRNAGFGFTMTSRKCLETMTRAARCYTDHPHKHVIANLFGQVYEPAHKGGDDSEDMLLSEDFSFCSRWRALGGKVMLLTKGGAIVHSGSYGFTAREIPGAFE
jgi:hypothetical protein